MLLSTIALASLSILAPIDPSSPGNFVLMDCDEDHDTCCPLQRLPSIDIDQGDVEDCFYGVVRADASDHLVMTSAV